MSEFVLLTDSSCDLSGELVEKLNVEVIPLRVTIDGKTYANYPDEREISSKNFYQLLREGKMATTAAITPAQVAEVVEPYLAAGKDVLYLGFSSGLSSTCTAGIMCARELNEKYSARLVVVDTLAASLGQGLLVWYAAKARDEGKTIDEVRDYIEGMKLNLCHWFTVNDLFHLKRGGRVSATTAVMGTLLNIKPVLHVDNDGHLISVSKARGRMASIRELMNRMKELAIDPEKQVIFISHGDCEDEAKILMDMIKREMNPVEFVINPVGPVIGAHAGPGVLALFFVGRER